jgi:signal transduction histidine kinase
MDTLQPMEPSRAEIESSYERLKLLYQVSSVIHSTLDPRQALELILREAVGLMRASSGSIVLLNPTTGFLDIEAAYGLPDNASALKLRVGEGITGWVAREGKPARVGQVASDPRYVMVRQNVASELAVPLEVNGEIRGVLNVDSERENAFSEEDEQLLQELALHAAKVIHNTWLYEQYRLKARLFESLVSVGQAINTTVTLDEALQVITREACVLMEAKMASLLLLDDSQQWLDLRASHGAGPEYVNKPRLQVGESLLGVVVRRKKPLQVENVQVSHRYQSIEIARREGLVSLLSVPLVFREQALGTLSVYTAELHSFSNEEIRILSALADLSAVAIEKARLYERVVSLEEELRRNEKLSVVGLLAAEVAHEIRNPLTVMKMLYQSLDLQFAADDPRAKDVEVIAAKMEHLNKIVEHVLALARSSEPQFAPVNLNGLLDELGLLTRHKLSHQNVVLVRKLDGKLPLITADARQLEQVFLNLMLNALEAMPDGGRLTVVTRGESASEKGQELNQVAVSFQDTGEGMTAEQQDRAFTSLLSSTKKKGTGLGLAIVSRIVEAHRGKIKVTSRKGHGTTITLTLPVKPEV